MYNSHPWDLRNVAVMQKDQWSVGFRLAVRAADWPLLTGGRYSEVAVRTGLTALNKKIKLLRTVQSYQIQAAF